MHIEHWMDAERLAESWMRDNGFPGARLTGGSADAGIDVRATNAIAQVKMETRPVGRPSLQRLVGARGTNAGLRLLFFSSSGYTAAARDYAQSMDIALMVYSEEGVVSRANTHARAIESSTSTGDHNSSSTTNVGVLLLAALVALSLGVVAAGWGVARLLGASNAWALVPAGGLLVVVAAASVALTLRSDTKADAKRIAAVRAPRPGSSLFDA